MKIVFVASFLFAFVCLAGMSGMAQEHAPTLAQCTADYRLWQAQITDYFNAEVNRINHDTPNHSEVMRMTMRNLSLRANELMACQSVDPERLDHYSNLQSEYNGAYQERFEMYIERHKLKKQVFEEGEAGLR